MSRSWRAAGLSCRNRANSFCGSTTARVKWSNVKPSSPSTAPSISLTDPASTSPSTASSRASLVLALPRLSSRTTRVAMYRRPAASKVRLTRASIAPIVTIGATLPLLP